MDAEKKHTILRKKQMMRTGEKNGSFSLGYCNKCLHCLNAFCLHYAIAVYHCKNGILAKRDKPDTKHTDKDKS